MTCAWKQAAKDWRQEATFWREEAFHQKWMFRFTLGALLLAAIFSVVSP